MSESHTPEAGPGRQALRRTYRAIRLLALGGILATLAWQIWGSRAILAGLPLRWHAVEISVAVIAIALAYQLLFLAWLLLLRGAGQYRPHMKLSYARVWWLSYLYRYVPGKLLLLVERARLGRALGIPYAAGAVFPIVETLVAILAGAAVSLLAVSYFARSTQLLAPLAALILGILFLVPAGYRWLARTRCLRERYPDLASLPLATADLLLVAIPYVAHYLLLGLAFFLLARVAKPLAWSLLPGICGIYALSHVFSLAVVIAPAGLGVREGTLAILLSRLVPAGVAGVLAIGVRVVFTMVELACFLLAVLPGRRRRAPGPSA